MNTWNPQANELFLRAIEYASPDEQRRFLDGACEGDAALLAEVEGLLAAGAQAGSFLEVPVSAARVAATVERPIAEQPGTVIGHYKLLEQIGEGGFGVVFMAEQQEPVRRKVALKLLKPGMDTRQVVARFEAERQALALMDHPNIARVFDGGTTDAGRPYFVMELVRGVPITEFCDQSALAIRQRLELFVDVCQTVQHAHQKGIIHRDIKPSNVMVTLHDGAPMVKVIDFGIAKAMGPQLTEKTLFTNFAQMVGTPLYMSPEQAAMSAQDIDTRGDIYSLGVLLYELLTGTTPFENERLRKVGYDEMRRIIREEEPPKPSTRVSTSGKLTVAACEKRQCDPHKLSRLVRGELDWIVMKALEKDRNRRYETANAFALDMRRYLRGEAVEACPPSTAYRFRKFARRNRVAIITASVVLASLVTGTAVATWQAMRATQAKAVVLLEKQRADNEAATATSMAESLKQLVGSLHPDLAKGPDYTARQLLDDYAHNLDAKLAGQPEVAADLHIIFGRAYSVLGARDKASKHLGRALLLRRNVFGDEHEKYAEVLVEHARPDSRDPSERPRCEAELRRALAIYRERGVAGEPVIRALWILSWLYMDWAYAGDAAKWDELERTVTDAEAEARRFPGREFPRLAGIYRYWAGAQIKHGRCAEAEAIARQALAMHLRLDGPNQLETAWGYHDLAESLRCQRRFAEALRAYQQALVIMRKLLPPGHTTLANVLDPVNDILASLLADARNDEPWADGFPTVAELGEWEAVYREVLATTKPDKLDGHDPVLQAIDGLGRCGELYLRLADEWAAAGKPREADKSRKKAVQLWEDLQTQLAGNVRLLSYLYANRGEALADMGRCDEAIACFSKACELDPNHSAGHTRVALGYARTKKWSDAAAAFDRALELDASDFDGWMLAAAVRAAMGDVAGYARICHGMLKRFGDAYDPMLAERTTKACLLMPEALSAEDFERVQKLAERAVSGTEQHGYYGFFAMAKGLADYRAGRYEEAIKWMEVSAPQVDGIHWDGAKFAVLAMAHHALEDDDEAETALNNAIAILAKMPDPDQGRPFGAGDWHDWVHAQVLCREAESLLKKPATETGR